MRSMGKWHLIPCKVSIGIVAPDGLPRGHKLFSHKQLVLVNGPCFHRVFLYLLQQ